MCGIVGLAGNFNKEMLSVALESIKHRGEDYSETYIDEENKIGLGHNLLSIFNLINQDEIYDNLEENKQPIILNDLVLVFNGEIYNFNKLESFLRENNPDYAESKSDSQLLANLINHYYNIFAEENNHEMLLESVKSVLPQLDGDYSFAVYDKKYNNIAVARDQIGVKPLFYGMNKDNDLKAFASEKKALWKSGIGDDDILDLMPGSVLYNWKAIDLDDSLINRIINTDFKELKGNYNDYKDYLDTKDSYEVYRELLADDLYSAVEKRVENIIDVGLIFSGGVDSTILALILDKISKNRQNRIENGESAIPLNLRLYSVGVENSQDVKFSRELVQSCRFPDRRGVPVPEVLRRTLGIGGGEFFYTVITAQNVIHSRRRIPWHDERPFITPLVRKFHGIIGDDKFLHHAVAGVILDAQE